MGWFLQKETNLQFSNVCQTDSLSCLNTIWNISGVHFFRFFQRKTHRKWNDLKDAETSRQTGGNRHGVRFALYYRTWQIISFPLWKLVVFPTSLFCLNLPVGSSREDFKIVWQVVYGKSYEPILVKTCSLVLIVQKVRTSKNFVEEHAEDISFETEITTRTFYKWHLLSDVLLH